MSRTDLTEMVAALDALPAGTMTGQIRGRRYIATKTLFNEGRSVKLVAQELGGADTISFNLYKLAGGPRLYPCEMPAEKTIRFVLHFEPDPLAPDCQ